MTALPSYFMVSESNGALYDTRPDGWSKAALRPNYSRHNREIRTVADLKAVLRAGPYAWPGGYPLMLICDDGGSLHFYCVRANLREVIAAIKDGHDSQWRVRYLEVNWEDAEAFCDHCGERIESAYAD